MFDHLAFATFALGTWDCAWNLETYDSVWPTLMSWFVGGSLDFKVLLNRRTQPFSVELNQN